jgi:hypothetical protein
MKGDAVSLDVAQDGEILTWQPVPDVKYYQVSITGYDWHWQSEPLSHATFNYSSLPLKPGNAYRAKISAYGTDGLITSAEQVINSPAIVTANFQ